MFVITAARRASPRRIRRLRLARPWSLHFTRVHGCVRPQAVFSARHHGLRHYLDPLRPLFLPARSRAAPGSVPGRSATMHRLARRVDDARSRAAPAPRRRRRRSGRRRPGSDRRPGPSRCARISSTCSGVARTPAEPHRDHVHAELLGERPARPLQEHLGGRVPVARRRLHVHAQRRGRCASRSYQTTWPLLARIMRLTPACWAASST